MTALPSAGSSATTQNQFRVKDKLPVSSVTHKKNTLLGGRGAGGGGGGWGDMAVVNRVLSLSLSSHPLSQVSFQENNTSLKNVLSLGNNFSVFLLNAAAFLQLHTTHGFYGGVEGVGGGWEWKSALFCFTTGSRFDAFSAPPSNRCILSAHKKALNSFSFLWIVSPFCDQSILSVNRLSFLCSLSLFINSMVSHRRTLLSVSNCIQVKTSKRTL